MHCNRHIHSMWKKEFTLEFSRDRKSMGAYVVATRTNEDDASSRSWRRITPELLINPNASAPKLVVKGAPDSVIERCTKLRVDDRTVVLTPQLKEEIMRVVMGYVHLREIFSEVALG